MVNGDRAFSRWRRAAGMGVAAAALATSVALVVPGGAAQAATGAWGTFALGGTAKAYTGSMTLPGDFPAALFTSTSSQATVVTGASTWQAASTPPGLLFGSSRNTTYLNQRPAADNAGSPSVTTYTFAAPTPAGGWSFVLGDIDADRATVSATDATGATVPVADLGFRGVYNYCHRAGGPSCDAANLNDVPSWNATTGVLTGNPAASDTEGASGWFSPDVPLSTLTITYQQRSGKPVYQTWFARTTVASGQVTVNGRPYGGDTVTVKDASAAVVATTTTSGDGTWNVSGLDSSGSYTATAAPPPGAPQEKPVAFDLSATSTTGIDTDYAVTPVAVTTTVSTADGAPAADLPLVITRVGDDAPTATVTTGPDGSFTAELLPSQRYTAVLDGATGQPIAFETRPTSGDPVRGPLVQPAATAPPVPPTDPMPPATSAPTPGPSSAPAAVDPVAAAPELAATGSTPVAPTLAGILVLVFGLSLVTVSRARRRSGRRSS